MQAPDLCTSGSDLGSALFEQNDLLHWLATD
jgi:hypothetical protein